MNVKFKLFFGGDDENWTRVLRGYPNISTIIVNFGTYIN